MRCYVMPVEVAGVGVGVVADLTTVGAAILDAKTTDTDRIRAIETHRTVVRIQLREFRLYLILKLVRH